MKLISYCIYIYILLKPFYIGKSGNLQISDIFIILAFILLLIKKNKEKNIHIKDDNNIMLKIKPLVLFIFLACSINFIYFLIYSTNDFLMSSIQYIFIGIGVYVFYNVLYYEKVIQNIKKVLKFDIIIQLIIYILKIGRYYSTYRYMGTFNDPNQFAFFVFLAFMIIITINNIYQIKEKTFFIYYIMVGFLIIQASSTGMTLGFLTYIMLILISNIKEIIKKLKMYLTKIVLCLSIIGIIIFTFILLYHTDDDFKDFMNVQTNAIKDSFIVERLTGKFDKLNINSEVSFIQDRCIDKILLYPQYILFGSGQGNYYRYEKAYSYNEVHSTLPSILFYYGIIPFVVLIYWIYSNLNNLQLKKYYIPYIAILIESFTLLNQRQLLLWFLICMGTIIPKKQLLINERN